MGFDYLTTIISSTPESTTVARQHHETIDAENMMRDDELVVEEVIAVIDRRPIGAMRLEDNGLYLQSVFYRC